ncbi:MAG: hypothetical protein U0Z44_09625 [Kouleothrix sp.]
MRARLKAYTQELFDKQGYTCNAANEIEGFLFKGRDAERRYYETRQFEFVNEGGYYHSLPGDPLRTFIDTVAEVQRAMGFANEKDHPELRPRSSRSISTPRRRSPPTRSCSISAICRQVADRFDMTASFLLTGYGRERQRYARNLSVSKGGKNIFYGTGAEGLGSAGLANIEQILTSANDICLALNASVNAYRRLDPHFEAPNQIKASPVDRGSMVRIDRQRGNRPASRCASVGPDAKHSTW